jgi:hypothetical protein
MVILFIFENKDGNLPLPNFLMNNLKIKLLDNLAPIPIRKIATPEQIIPPLNLLPKVHLHNIRQPLIHQNNPAILLTNPN